MGKISGPLLDRIDIHVEIVPVPFEKLRDKPSGEPSAAIRARVVAARKIQENRFKNHDGIYCNAQMSSKLLQQYAPLDAESSELLRLAMAKFAFSARAYDKIVKMARTIADLAGEENISSDHIAEAINFRCLDRGDRKY